MKYRIHAIDDVGAELPYATAENRRDAIAIAQHLAYYRVRAPGGEVIAEALPLDEPATVAAARTVA